MFFTQGCFFLVTDPEVWMLGMALGSIGLQPVHTCCICFFFLRDQSDPRKKLGVNIKRIIGQNHEPLPLGLHRTPEAR